MRRLILFFMSCIPMLVFAQKPEVSLHVDSTGSTQVCIKAGSGGRIAIQSYRWNKWVTMDQFYVEVKGRDTCVRHWVSLHSGENTMRLSITPLDTAHGIQVVAEIKVQNGPPLRQNEMGGHYDSDDTLHFSHFTIWEIYDQNGRMMKKGESDSIPLSGLEQAGYFLLYDNIVTEVLICDHKQE